jgi:hypothetical protein
MRIHQSIFAVGSMLALAHATAARAGIITAGDVRLPPFSTGSVGPFGANPAPNNNNAAAQSANMISYSIFFNSPGFAEVEYVTGDSGGTTEYFISQNLLVNNSGVVWAGFRFELGFGTDSDFVRAPAGVALDFDVPDADPAPFSSVFTNIDHQPNVITWSGGTVPFVRPVAFRLSIDVPDGLDTWHPQGLRRFTLRQTPLTAETAIPEPSSILLTAAALLPLLMLTCKRRGCTW